MKPFEEQFTAWVDGQMSETELAEFEKQLTAHPEAATEKHEALRLGKLLRTHPTAPRLSNPDFFNHQLMQRIAAETPRPVEKERVSFWSLPRLALAGAFSLLVAFGLYKTTIPTGTAAGDPSKYFAQVVEAWPSDPSISATTVYSSEDNVTVLWLDGLDYIPATYALK
jgi:anti-sigma factor RsiW